MRRAALWAGVLALAALAAGATPWPVSPAWVVASLNAGSGPAPAAIWSAPEAATFSVFPWPGLRLVDARLNDGAGENLVAAPQAQVDLSLPGLLLGRATPANVALTAPTITLDLDRAPFAGTLDGARAALSIARFAPFGGLSVTDGVARVTSRKRGWDTVVEGLQGRVNGLAPGAPLMIDLSAMWREVALSVSGSLDDPRRAAQGKPSGFAVKVSSSLGDLSFSGALTAGATPGAAGDLSASSNSLPQVARLFGLPQPNPAIKDLSVSGKVRLTPADVVFDGATMTSGGQTLQGALRLAKGDGRVAISGSLDAERLALGPWLGPGWPPFATGGRWSRVPASFSLPRNLDLDLRLSVGSLDVFGTSLKNVAASALLKDGALTASLVDATAFGGRGQGDMRLGFDGDDLVVSARGTLAGADAGAFGSGPGWPEVSGKATSEFAIETAGRSVAALVAGLRGKASVSLQDGALAGVNLEGALRRSQRHPLDVAKDLRNGSTAFETADLDVVIADGVARIVEGGLFAEGARANLEGEVDLGAQEVRLRVDARQADLAGGEPADAARLRLDIDGPWSAPTVQAVDPGDGAPAASPRP